MKDSSFSRGANRYWAMCVAVLMLWPAMVASAATRYWRNNAGSTSWNVAANWSSVSAADVNPANNGVPLGGEPVNLVHTDGTARTVTYNVNAPSIGLLSIDLTGAGAATDTLSIPNNNSLSANGIWVGGYSGVVATAGRGAVNQSAGTVATTSGSDFVLGYGAGSTGTYMLSGGNLTGAQSEFIGWGGTASFNHSAGTNTISAGAVGAFDVGILLGSTGTYNLSGTGQLISNKSEYIGDSGTGFFNQTGGSNTIQGLSHHLYLGNSSTGVGTYTLSGGSLSVAGDEYIGFASLAENTFNQTGGMHSITGALFIGCNNSGSGGSASRGTYSISGAATLSAQAVVVDGTNSAGTLSISNGGTVSIAGISGINDSGIVNVSGPGSTLTTSILEPDGNLHIVNAGAVHVSDQVVISGNGSISVNGAGASLISSLFYNLPGWGGSITIGDQGLMDIGSLNFYNGTINLQGGTLAINSYFRNPAPTVTTLNFTAGTVHLTGNRTVGSDLAIADFFGATTAATITAGKGLTVDGTLTVQSLITLDGGTLSVGTLVNNGTFNFDSGTLNVNQASANINTPIVTGNPSTININATNISLGSASSFTGFNHQGTLNVGANIVTLNSAGYARLGVLTSLAGGSIFASNGVTLPSGSNLQGFGSISARVTGEKGSVIEATSSLAMGDAVSPAGFNFDGELRTKQNTVTLISSAAAGLGILTTLGNGASPGTLNATNGFVVDFDEAVTGYGTINSSNTLAKHATINGTVLGNSVEQPITLSGYIKGVFSYTNVNFSGTYSPGLSPTIAMAGNVGFSSSNTLIMELGGTAPGTEYDQIQSSGAFAFGGTLLVSLINGFTPANGQSFNFFDWATTSGTFATLQLPTLSSGLAWNKSQLYTTGVLQVDNNGIPGDYNGNGTVDAADYVTWRKGLGTTYTQNDYDVWRAHFGQTAGSGSGAIANADVPEPDSLLLLMLTTRGWSFRRGRKE